MIGSHIEGLLTHSDEPLMVCANDVATVRTENNLLHALLVLSSVGFNSIPVIDQNSQIKGIISMPMIINGVLKDDDYDWNLLSERKVKDVMDSSVRTLSIDAQFEDILHMLVDQNYLCVADKNGVFRGIITRKAMLKRVNYMAHEFERIYNVRLKEEFRPETKKDFRNDSFVPRTELLRGRAD
ncbi:MAG: CBS domain-containing protein [Clostridiaceae bacterium]|jgi:predicted transcriptional regulator|nr:CBS domain-containing protein [Clostridiaceae bacterium]